MKILSKINYIYPWDFDFNKRMFWNLYHRKIFRFLENFGPIFQVFFIFFSPPKLQFFIRIMIKIEKIDRVYHRILIILDSFFTKTPDRIENVRFYKMTIFFNYFLPGIIHFVLNYEIFFTKNWIFSFFGQIFCWILRITN